MSTNIAIFASGAGSNARKIVEYFLHHPSIHVSLICSNKADAKVLDLTKEYDVAKFYFDKAQMTSGHGIMHVLKEEKIDFIILAGFLWKFPDYLIRQFEHKIINIHPSLLPKYGGKGMYGHFVHEAVKTNNDSESGISIHLVNGEYDRGRIIFQKKCSLSPHDEAQDIQAKVQQLEHQYFPSVIEEYILHQQI